MVWYSHLLNNFPQFVVIFVTTATKLKKLLLLIKKAMTNLDSILKSKDITLLTKVHILKDMVLPVARYGCESWTIKKAKYQKN